MRYDLDLLLHILQAVENAPPGKRLGHKDFNENLDTRVLNEHVRALEKEGFIEAAIITGPIAETYSYGVTNFFINRLELQGQLFLDGARRPGIWDRVKKLVGDQTGPFTVMAVFEIVKALLKNAVGN